MRVGQFYCKFSILLILLVKHTGKIILALNSATFHSCLPTCTCMHSLKGGLVGSQPSSDLIHALSGLLSLQE